MWTAITASLLMSAPNLKVEHRRSSTPWPRRVSAWQIAEGLAACEIVVDRLGRRKCCEHEDETALRLVVDPDFVVRTGAPPHSRTVRKKVVAKPFPNLGSLAEALLPCNNHVGACQNHRVGIV